MTFLGPFEELILLATINLGENAYGVTIIEEIERATDRRVHQGSLSTAITRLEGRGFVQTELGDPTAERGGRAKRFVIVTGAGKAALRDTDRARQDVQRLRKTVPAWRLRPT